MSIHSALFYSVSCDYPGCEYNTGDIGEYSAWMELGSAIEEWTEADNIVVEVGPDDKRFYCYHHTIWNPDDDAEEARVPVPEGVEGEFILLDRKLRATASNLADKANHTLRRMVTDGATRHALWEQEMWAQGYVFGEMRDLIARRERLQDASR